MIKFDDLKTRYNKLTKSKKIQLTLAITFTLALLVAIPVFAWFSYQRHIVKLQKIESPNTLVLSAAHREDETCFEINGINADEIAVDVSGNKLTEIVNGKTQDKKITYKDYVFCVTGDAVDKFTIQLAYTTNNPFTYELYAAKELTATELETDIASDKNKSIITDTSPIDYVAYTVEGEPVAGMPTLVTDDSNNYHTTAIKDDLLYYRIDYSVTDPTSEINAAVAGKYTGRYLNSSNNGVSANNDTDLTYQKKAYDEYTNIQDDAKPVYWQANNVSAFPGKVNSMKDPFSRHFILRVKWNAGALDNTAKETDIIYITVKATS